MYLYHNDALPISFTQSFKLETRFINIQQVTLTFTDLIHVSVQQILKNFRSCFKVLEYGILYRSTSKMPRLLVYHGCDQTIFKGQTE